MEFRTKIGLNKSDIGINHQTKILMIGSCFANNIGQRLLANKFNIILNPFGVLYNPISIAKAIDLLIEKKEFTENDLFFDKGQYHSFYHHSDFSDTDKTKCLNKINASLQQASQQIYEADLLSITFGTAYVYQYKETKEVVGNCHKLPTSAFERYRLSVDEITDRWIKIIDKLKSINQGLSIIFTVSPIRHLRDGMHDNLLSKATLLLAVDEIRKKSESTEYFPSYEIMLDDLRDYRFYAQDMVHPSEIAIDYIWNIFEQTYFNNETQNIIGDWQKLKKAIDHRPFNQGSPEHIYFLKQTLLKVESFSTKYPFICLNSEIDRLKAQIND